MSSYSHLFSRGIIVSLLVFTMSGLVVADTIRLKDGSRIKGKIVGFKGNKFTVAIGQGARRRELNFAAAEIESIEFTAPDAAEQLTASAKRPETYNAPVVRPPDVDKQSATEPAGPPTIKVAAKTEPEDEVVSEPAADTRPAETKPVPQVQSDPAPVVVKKADPKVANKPVPSGGRMTPVSWNVKVLADNTSNGWTNSGWVVKKGQRIRIVGDGSVSLGKGQTSPPSGLAKLEDPQKLLPNVPTGALVAVIGDNNNDFIYVGAEREFVATRDGALFLGVNEGKLEDNAGSFDVKVEILPETSN